MNRFNNWDEIEAFKDETFGITGLTPAEAELKTALAAGEFCTLGIRGDLPENPHSWNTPDPSCHIRADVLRYALTRPLGAIDTTEIGVFIRGGLISGKLNLMNCTVHGNAVLKFCRFQNIVFAARTTFMENVNLMGSHLPAFIAAGTDIYGQLDCSNVTFSKSRGDALNLQGTTIKSAFFFRDVTSVSGPVNLSSAYVANLVDDPESWEMCEDLILDGFTYERIGGNQSAIDYKARLLWLAKGDHYGKAFYPQPYTQLAKVLQEMGHELDAREIRIALAEKMKQRQRKINAVVPTGDIGVGFRSLWGDIRVLWLLLRHVTSRLLTGHGYKPVRAMWALLILLCCAWFMVHKAWNAGDFTPNSALVLNSADWRNLEGSPHQADAWDATLSGKDWETFQPLAYAVDVVIPIVDFGQAKTWAPSTNRGWWGKQLWWARWFFTAAGWLISALGAAAITGVVRRD